MSISVDTINLRFNVKPDYDQQQLQQLQEDLKQGQKELEKTRRAMDKLSKNGLSAMTKEQREEFDKLSVHLTKTAREVHENEQKMKQWTDNININKLSLQQLGQRAKDLTAVLNNLNPNTDEFRDYKSELDRVKERMKELRSSANDTKESLGKFGSGIFGSISKGVIALNAALQIKDRIVQWADQYVQSFAQMDEAMTDVMKYTGQTKREVEEMNETFKQMETRTAREELNALAGAAGRLGITARKDIEGFVSAADKINVALGDDLGEGAIDQIGKLTMVFGEDKKKGLEGAMLATGSAINVLGASSSANTGFITEFTSRMAGMAVNARISQTDIMGYASALSQAGIEGETASGVFAQMITKMFTDPAKFAKAAGLEVKAFTDLLKTDANQAILQFLEGLKSKGGFDSLAPALKSLQMQGTQAVPVISSLINKMDELKQAQQTASTAYEQGTSIIDEFNNANSSAAAKLDIAKKGLNDVSVELGQKLMPIVEGSITASTSVLKILSAIVGFIVPNIKAVIQLTTAIAAYTVAVNAAAIANSRFVTSAKNALVATRQWFATLAANPVGLAAAALTLFAGEIVNYVSRARKAAQIQEEMNEAMREAKKEIASERAEMDSLIGTVKSATASENERREALEKLNGKLMSLHLGNLTEEQVRTGDLTTMLDAYNKKLETSIKLKQLQAKQEELINQKIDLEEGGYKDDISFVDRIAQGTAAAGQALISGHLQGFGNAWDAEWNRVEESFKKRALRPIMEGLDNVSNQIAKIKEEEEKAANTVNYVGEVVVTPGMKGSSSSSTTSKTDSELRKEKAERDRQRRELEAEAKQAYEEELLRLKQQYQGRQSLADEQRRLELSAEERYIDRLARIRTEKGASEAEKMEVANKQLDLIIKKSDLKRQEQQKEQNRRLQQEDMRHNEQLLTEAQKRLRGEYSDEEAYNLRLEQLEIEHQQRMLEIRRAAGEDVTKEQKQLADMTYEHRKKQLQKQENDSAASQDAANSWLRDVEWYGQSLDKMRQLNDLYHQQGLISEQQYQQNLTDIDRQETEKRRAIQQAAIDSAGTLLSSASQLFSAMQQRETSAVDAKYKKMIAAAKKQGRDTTRLEEQQEAEKQEIAKKYADRNFQIQVLQIVANTAQGVTKTIAELGMPWAIPFVAMVTAAGAMQLASAKAAADQAAGLYEGGYNDEYQEGYTRKGDPKKQAGVIPVHQSEFVANHKAVANPEVRPVLDVIDRHQKRGDIQMLNSTRMLEEAYGSGRYRGGYSGSEGGSDPDEGDSKRKTPADSQEKIQLLREIARNTENSMTIRDVRKEIRHEERLESNARR